MRREWRHRLLFPSLLLAFTLSSLSLGCGEEEKVEPIIKPTKQQIQSPKKENDKKQKVESFRKNEPVVI